MTKAELIKKLSGWPDEINLSLFIVNDEGDGQEFPLTDVEDIPEDLDNRTGCFLFGGDF